MGKSKEEKADSFDDSEVKGHYSNDVYFVSDGTSDINCLLCGLLRPGSSQSAAWYEWLSVMGGSRRFWQTGKHKFKANKFKITIES